MSETEETEQDDRRPSRSERRRTRRHARAEVHQKRAVRRMFPKLLLSAFLFFLIALILTERQIPLPPWARDRIEATVNDQLADNPFQVGRTSVSLGPEGGAQVRLSNVRLGDPGGGASAVLNTVRASLVPSALLQGRLKPETVTLDGAQVTLRRTADGGFSFVADTDATERLGLSDVLGRLDDILSDDSLASIRQITADEVVLTLEDARSGRIWQATNARLVLRRIDTGLTLSLTSDVFNGTDNLAQVQLSFDFLSATRDTSLGVRVSNMPAADIALQSPILAWLGVLDAPISGAVRADYDGSSGLTSLAGTLDIAAGALNPVEGSEPQPFEQARADFRFDPKRQRLNFSDISVASETLAIQATGHTYLTDLDGGWPSAFVGQFRVGEVRFADNGLLADPIALTDLTADMRLRLDPFTVDLAQVTAPNEGHPVRASGHIEARSDGWSFAVDARTDEISSETVMAFWPLIEAKGTRTWLSNNLRAGRLTDVTAAVRKVPGSKSDIGLNFNFDDGHVQFLREMPPIENGQGRGTIVNNQFTLVLDEGTLMPEGGGVIDGAGSVMIVPDIEEKPVRGIFDIRARGALTDMFRVLAKPPVRLLDRLDRGLDLAEGEAEVAARLELPLLKDLQADQVTYDVLAELRDGLSDTIIKNRTLTGDTLRVAISQDDITVSGPMALDGVPLSATWQQSLGAGEGSRATGRVRLSAETLAAFDVPLPGDLIGGAASADFTLAIPPGTPPRLTLASDLRGMSLRIGSLGWSKSSATAAPFALDATLGDTPEVTNFTLDAPALALTGRVAAAGDGFGDITLDTLRVGRWLDASARISPRADGPVQLALTGGRLSLRDLPDGGGGGGAGARIPVSLDTLVVTDNLRLSPFQGELSTGRAGLSGDFQGRLNGGTVVRAALAPSPNGTSVRIQANDAGGVIRDARLSPNARGGTMDIVMTPAGDGSSAGSYSGQFLIENIALKDAPVMAALLDAMSVVGLLDQLSGSGIRFSTIDGQFRLTPQRLTVRDAAATGASLGVSANGIYDFAKGRMDIEGVVSPFYFVNAVGSLVSRRGEGLFGVNYRVSGEVSRPRISVNPLSILAPGAFRQIFRRAPPTE